MRPIRRTLLASLLAVVFPAAPPAQAGGRPAAGEAAVFVLRNARLLDGKSPARDGMTIVVRGERIAAVGPDADVEAPANAEVRDVGGKSVLPGLFDTHGHYFTVDGTTQYEAFPKLCLAAGVTSVFAPGEVDPESAVALRERLRTGEEVGARLLTAGPYFEHGQGELRWLKGFDDVDGAVALLARWQDRIDGVKILQNVTEAEFTTIVQGAHAAGLRVTGHLGSITAKRAAELGIDRLEHGIYAMDELAPARVGSRDEWVAKCQKLAALDLDSDLVRQLLDTLLEHRVVLSATSASFEFVLPEWEPVVDDWLRYLAPPVRRLVSGARKRMQQTPDDEAAAMRGTLHKHLAFLKRFADRGGVVVTGSDAAGKVLTPGFAVHREMRLLVQGGFTPLQAIRAATCDAAVALGQDADLGTIAPGKLADLVVVDGRPDEDITAMRAIVEVWQAGRRHDPAALCEAAVGQIR